MHVPPSDLGDDTLRACLRTQYGVAATELDYLPLGYDAWAWVYQVQTADGATYFLKVKAGRRPPNEASLWVPRYLRDRGITQVVAPLRTTSGDLWTATGDYSLVLYPFVAGRSGRDQGMTDQQWIDYGRLLRQVHDTAVDPELARVMGRDAYRPGGADLVRRLDAHIAAAGDAVEDPAERMLARFWQEHRDEIQTLLERAETLGQRLAAAGLPLVLCHADIHTANLLLDRAGQVWIVDWDETLLAPRERDLMFVVGGISREWVSPREEALFFQGYGATTVDPLALAYYRYNWAVSDIGEFGAEVFFRPDRSPSGKQEAAEMLIGLFNPGEIVSLAFAAGYPT